jgi:hypothetical protein
MVEFNPFGLDINWHIGVLHAPDAVASLNTLSVLLPQFLGLNDDMYAHNG